MIQTVWPVNAESNIMNNLQKTERGERASNHEHLESDLGTAAFLVVRRFPLLGLRQVGTGRYGFRFADSACEAGAAAMAYLQGESVPAKQLIAAERDLKTLLYAQKNGNENGNSTNNLNSRIPNK